MQRVATNGDDKANEKGNSKGGKDWSLCKHVDEPIEGSFHLRSQDLVATNAFGILVIS